MVSLSPSLITSISALWMETTNVSCHNERRKEGTQIDTKIGYKEGESSCVY
jgi:hypothetical protein